MHWVHVITAVILIISATAAKQDDSNEIDPLRPPINLDANLRRALLKALTELENEDKEKERAKNPESREKSFERASASAVSFYSHSVSSERPSSTTTDTEDPTTEQPSVVIQKSSGIQSRPITTYIRDGDGDEIIPSASNSFNSPQNSIYVTPKKNDKVSYQQKSTRKSTKRPRPTTTQTTTPTTTTSTEENEAKVEDLQFFSAPLVAAFTVHQDERGIPQSVVPIYKTLEQKAAKKKPAEQTTAKQQFEQSTFKPQNQFAQQNNFPSPSESYRNEVQNQKLSEGEFRALQEELQEKQKILEEELQKLHQQQKHHDLLLRQQQILQEERLIIEKQKLVNEQIKLNSSQKPFITPTAGTFTTPTFAHSTLTTPQFVQPKFSTPAFVPTRFNNNPETTSKRTSVVLQPSVTFNSGLPTNGQILPVKNAGNFRTPFLQSFNLISPQQTLPRQSFPQQQQQQQQLQQQRPFLQQQASFRTQQFSQQSSQPSSNSNNQQNVNILKSSSAYFSPQHNRVFRQEANVGNFGFNNNNNNFNNNNRFNNFNTQQQQNRFFRSNNPTTTNNNNNNLQQNSFRAQPPVVNNRLNNLLYNSGFYKGRQQEDINVVSKVLSLNHFGGDLRFDSSNINEQRITRPIVNKV